MDLLAEALATSHVSLLQRKFETSGAGIFLLVDPMLGDPVLPNVPEPALTKDALNALRAKAWQRQCHALALPEKLDMDGAYAPYLVELRGGKDPWLELSVQWAVQETIRTWTTQADQPVPHRVGGWLQSAAFGARLAEHLTGWLRLCAPRQTTASYLRIADRRVLGLAVHVLGESHVAQSMTPVQHWYWLDPLSAMRVIGASAERAADESQAPAQLPASRGGPLACFNQAQWAQMQVGPQAHDLLARAAGQQLANLRMPSIPSHGQPLTAAQWQVALDQARRDRKVTQRERNS